MEILKRKQKYVTKLSYQLRFYDRTTNVIFYVIKDKQCETKVKLRQYNAKSFVDMRGSFVPGIYLPHCIT